jgi:dolichol-phosphate mannosyltransferase
VTDVCNAFLLSANNISKIRGDVFNIGSGIKTTIGQLAELIRKEFGIKETPTFSVMPNRDWDVMDWYSDSRKAEEILGWRSTIELGQGIIQVSEWQQEVDYDNAYWNFNK